MISLRRPPACIIFPFNRKAHLTGPAVPRVAIGASANRLGEWALLCRRELDSLPICRVIHCRRPFGAAGGSQNLEAPRRVPLADVVASALCEGGPLFSEVQGTVHGWSIRLKIYFVFTVLNFN